MVIGAKRLVSSPPSPVLDFPPILFIATARAVWTSVEIAPIDMAPVAKRFTISVAGSTSSRGTGAPRGLMVKRPRRVIWRFD